MRVARIGRRRRQNEKARLRRAARAVRTALPMNRGRIDGAMGSRGDHNLCDSASNGRAVARGVERSIKRLQSPPDLGSATPGEGLSVAEERYDRGAVEKGGFYRASILPSTRPTAGGKGSALSPPISDRRRSSPFTCRADQPGHAVPSWRTSEQSWTIAAAAARHGRAGRRVAHRTSRGRWRSPVNRREREHAEVQVAHWSRSLASLLSAKQDQGQPAAHRGVFSCSNCTGLPLADLAADQNSRSAAANCPGK